MDTPKKVGYVYKSKADLLAFVYRDSMKALEKNDSRYQKMLSEVNGNYEKAIQTCNECGILWRKNRYTFLSRVNEKENPIYLTDLETLKKAGFKEDREGLGVGLKYMHGKESWYGFTSNILLLMHPTYKIKGFNAELGKKDVLDKNLIPLTMSLCNFGYAYSPSAKIHDFTLDLIKMQGPIYLNPTQIGWQYWVEENANYGFYRPEIGLGYGIFSLTYSYNLMFKKTKRADAEKHLLSAHICYPLVKYKNF